MSSGRLDGVDRAILYALQRDARASPNEIARRVDVSGNTVRNRIGKLEEAGVITGYTAKIDYNRTSLQLHYRFICTARVSRRDELAPEALDIPGVIGVETLMTGERNVLVEALGTDNDDITSIASELDRLGLQVNEEFLIREQLSHPLHYFAEAEL